MRGRGAERMARCVVILRAKLPWYVRWAVTEKNAKWLIQIAFDGIKALLEHAQGI